MWLKSSLFLALSYLHYLHISSLFENDRFFSHLSPMEREMTFRTEAGFYYSYYKTIVRAPTFLDGWQALVNDTGMEYPNHINALQRFNVYPEVLLGGMFRIFRDTTERMGVSDYFRVCYGINRGKGLEPVQSCVGAGDESIFYLNAVFALSGLQAGFIFLLCCYMSDSVLGGIVAVSAFFFNHSECSRVQWIPPLRESFSFPFLILQSLALSVILKSGASNQKKISLALSTVCFVLPWQFSQFVLLTQTLSLFASYVLSFLSADRLTPALDAIFAGYAVGTLLQFLNTMLLSSLYVAAYLAFKAVIFLNGRSHLANRYLRFVRDLVVFLIVALSFKMGSAALLQLSDDAHIFNIFKAKFTDFRDFHTLLYICGRAFDFIEMQTFYKCVRTLLLPTTVAVIGRLCWVFGKQLFCKNEQQPAAEDEPAASEPAPTEPSKKQPSKKGQRSAEKPVKKTQKSVESVAPGEEVSHNYLSYHVFQFGCYFIMAVMIMRLKLFMTPYMCVLSSLVASKFVLPQTDKSRIVIIGLLLGAMSIDGYQNLQNQWKIEGEYNNPNQEELFTWIEKHTDMDAVFAGPMPIMANLRLSTGRNIVNHPHYEDSGLRARTKEVYQLFSRKPGDEVHATLSALQVQYAVLDKHWCTARRPRAGCSIPEIWDNEDLVNVGRPTFCDDVPNYQDLFDLQFSNKMFRVIKLKN